MIRAMHLECKRQRWRVLHGEQGAIVAVKERTEEDRYRGERDH